MSELCIDYGRIVNQMVMDVLIRDFYNGNTLKCRAIVDTGAMRSAISTRVFKTLGCTAINKVVVNGIGGKIVAPTTLVDVALSSAIVFNKVNSTVLDMGGVIDFLFGMDILCRCDASILNDFGRTVFLVGTALSH